ncbi:MAG: hypothetical protein ACI9BO_000977 [Zhongshania sp.]|jgi:hypothetical protein
MCPVWQQRMLEMLDTVEAGIDWFTQNMQLMHSR